MLKSIHKLITLALVFIFVCSPLVAQQKRHTAPKKPIAAEAAEPPPTFDTLLAADSYKVYCEVRAVGGLIRSSAVNDLLDPVMKLGGPPKEFKTLVKWLNAHAEVLAGSRMLVTGWPSRPNLPTVLVAIEFSSPEEAKKFYPELSGFLPTLLPSPSPTSSGSPAAGGPKLVPATPNSGPFQKPEKEAAPVAPPYQMKLSGALILISEKEFTFRSLRPPRSKPLEEDQNFLLARNRFASESLFVYVDLKSIEKEEKDRQKKWEEEEQKRIEAQAANPPKEEELPNPAEAAANEPQPEEQPPPPPEPEPTTSSRATLVVGTSDPQASSNATLSGQPRTSGYEISMPMMYSFYAALFGGESKWPEAVSAALVFEGDAYVLRVLIVNGPENKNNAIPFIPQFASGPPLVPEASSVFPADTDLFASVSLDYPQVYEGMLKAIANAEVMARKYSRTVKDALPPPESPLAAFEKKLGFKIKDDLIPLLGNELAVALPKRVSSPSPSPTPSEPGTFKATTEPNQQKSGSTADPTPVIAISVKDREAVARMIPKIIEAFGLKGANFFAQTEKRDGAEITSYGDIFAYAFLGDFLVLSADTLATRRAVDAYLNHETLSSNSHFRNFTRWQPRQVLGQVYVAPSLIEQYGEETFRGRPPGNNKLAEFLSRVNPVIDPLTYSLTNDGQGPLHELHVPKNLLQLMVAGVSSEASQAPLESNEAIARSALRTIASAEATFQATKGDGRFGSLDELVTENLVSKDMLQKYGYRIELNVSAKGFEAIAVPVTYGESGKLSYFIDETSVLRGGDHAGGAATIADQPRE
jgi:biotin carboxyl carrier protein